MGVLRREPATPPRVDNHDVHSILGPESSFSGTLTFRGTVRIDGRFDGDIRADGNLIIGQDARLSANASVGHLVVFGEVQGDLTATQAIEIHASAKVRGNIAAPTIMIEKGATFEGSCRMQPAGAADAADAAPSSDSAVTTDGFGHDDNVATLQRSSAQH